MTNETKLLSAFHAFLLCNSPPLLLTPSLTHYRMQNALKLFAVDDLSVSGYIYHTLLGAKVEPQELDVRLPQDMSAPGLPALNDSQSQALKEVLRR